MDQKQIESPCSEYHAHAVEDVPQILSSAVRSVGCAKIPQVVTVWDVPQGSQDAAAFRMRFQNSTPLVFWAAAEIRVGAY